MTQIKVFENWILNALIGVVGSFAVWCFNGNVHTIKRETVSDVLNELKQKDNKGG
jgi:hypothetical protein